MNERDEEADLRTCEEAIAQMERDEGYLTHTHKAFLGKLKTLCHYIHALRSERDESARLRARLLTAAGDDLCRLTQEEIKAMSSGAVKIPPKDEFLASCERFHAQVAGEVGVNENCLTLAQLIAENEQLKQRCVDANYEIEVLRGFRPHPALSPNPARDEGERE